MHISPKVTVGLGTAELCLDTPTNSLVLFECLPGQIGAIVEPHERLERMLTVEFRSTDAIDRWIFQLLQLKFHMTASDPPR